ncbi:MAG TPA: 30S ribosomal protein S18 [Candidatus Paceibacterota bacterium]|jgi:small subunit ribosomal protein S18|nr:30S ribosomal protein S18 [Candidatus Paceibacterota bacterium]
MSQQQCYFKSNNIKYIDYKDIEILKKFLGSTGKILPRRRTGTTLKNQRALALAVKRARFMGLLPYIEA